MYIIKSLSDTNIVLNASVKNDIISTHRSIKEFGHLQFAHIPGFSLEFIDTYMHLVYNATSVIAVLEGLYDIVKYDLLVQLSKIQSNDTKYFDIIVVKIINLFITLIYQFVKIYKDNYNDLPAKYINIEDLVIRDNKKINIVLVNKNMNEFIRKNIIDNTIHNKIILIDDSILDIKMNKRVIKECFPNPFILELHDGNELPMDASSFDFIIVDENMVNMNGSEMIKKLRNESFIKCVFSITSNYNYKDNELILNAGADVLIIKPLTIKRLSAGIEMYNNQVVVLNKKIKEDNILRAKSLDTVKQFDENEISIKIPYVQPTMTFFEFILSFLNLRKKRRITPLYN
jgi:DNA-binding NarL/FixJ family response regulator